jgi:palmitoyl-protein thioesterase
MADCPCYRRATFFGSATAQIDRVCEQLQVLPELFDPSLNPSGHFDAIGFSQGGQLLRGAIERCGLPVRNLITLGSQHMGISSLPPCPPGAGPFSTCRLMHLSIVRWGLYSSWAQSNIIPAQYVRDEARIDDYLRVNTFLKDINNERVGDKQVGPPDVLDERDEPEEPEPRNATYKANLSSVKNFVMFRFSSVPSSHAPQYRF